jgi:hypothetical protein
MSNMRELMEKAGFPFAGQVVGQKPGDQVRGSEPMPRQGGYKKHPYAGRLVGGESILRELEKQIVEGNVERRLREEFSNTVKSAADKIVAAGGTTRDALGSALGAIPRPFDEKEVAKDLLQVQNTQPKTSWRNTNKKMQEDDIVSEWGAPGTAVGPGNDDADPVEIAAQRMQQTGGKEQAKSQIDGLVAQMQGARAQLADMNQQFPQGANPVEKAMAMQQMSAQKIDVKKQIEDLSKQIAALRPQAL